jgi:hypothetical protein
VDKQMQDLDKRIKAIKLKEGYDPYLNKKKQEMYDMEEGGEGNK